MELWRLVYLFEPPYVALIVTSVGVVLASAQRALTVEKETERHRTGGRRVGAPVTLATAHAILIPIACSCCLLIMFYFFSSVMIIVTVSIVAAAPLSLGFVLAPYMTALTGRLGDVVLVRRTWWGPFSLSQAILAISCGGVVANWMLTGHWLVNNVLGISLCIAFVSNVRLPNIRVCALLLVCLFLYDIFWVFFSEQLFGSNVMVTVATRQTFNPMHTVASSLNLPAFAQVVPKNLDLPVKLIFPSTSFWTKSGGVFEDAYLMLGLGDMVVPGMLLSLILSFEHRKVKEHDSGGRFSRDRKYIQYGGCGYAFGMIAALTANLLSESPQPALLYLVPTTLGSILFAAWAQDELIELWSGPMRILGEMTNPMEP